MLNYFIVNFSCQPGSSVNDSRSYVYDHSEFKIFSDYCHPNCCRTNCGHFVNFSNFPSTQTYRYIENDDSFILVLDYLCTCLLVYLCIVYLCTCIIVYLCTCLLVYLCMCVLVYLCTCVLGYLCICIFVCLFICVLVNYCTSVLVSCVHPLIRLHGGGKFLF